MTHIIRKPYLSWVRWRHHFPIFCISLNIKNGGTWRISFESSCRVESDDVITFRIEPRDVADFSYLVKYLKWRHETHIIRKSSQRWVWSCHHFPHRTTGCRRFFVSHSIFKMKARDPYLLKALSDLSPMTSSFSDFLYLIKYSKWRYVTHIIRKPLPSWVRWRHHFPNRTSGCCRFFVSG